MSNYKKELQSTSSGVTDVPEPETFTKYPFVKCDKGGKRFYYTQLKDNGEKGDEVELGESFKAVICAGFRTLTKFPPYRKGATGVKPLVQCSGVTKPDELSKDSVSGMVQTFAQWRASTEDARVQFNVHAILDNMDKVIIPLSGFAIGARNENNIYKYLNSFKDEHPAEFLTDFSIGRSSYVDEETGNEVSFNFIQFHQAEKVENPTLQKEVLEYVREKQEDHTNYQKTLQAEQTPAQPQTAEATDNAAQEYEAGAMPKEEK